MRPVHSVLIFLFFAVSSAFSGMKSYSDARQMADADLQQALVLTLATQGGDIITPDTITNYRTHLAIAELRDTAYLAYTLQGEIRANCSTATIWRISDQRLSALLALFASFWAVSSVFWFRRRVVAEVAEGIVMGGLRYLEADDRFYDAAGQPVHLTPMQHHLLTMFFLAPSHELSQGDITQALWPKKPDATETLHTLVRRLKTSLSQHSTLTLTVDRGRSYHLSEA